MNVAVKVLKIFAAMSDHGLRKGSQRFRRNLDWAGDEKLVVRNHTKRSTFNAKRSTSNAEDSRDARIHERLEQNGISPALSFVPDEADVAAAFDPCLFHF